MYKIKYVLKYSNKMNVTVPGSGKVKEKNILKKHEFKQIDTLD